MKKRILVIPGGTSFDSYESFMEYLESMTLTEDRMRQGSGWKGSLQEKLGSDFDVLRPEMPNRMNAKYSEWSLWFKKLLALSDEPIILIGHSLGAEFLAKFLNTEQVTSSITATIMVSGPFDEGSDGEKLAEFNVEGPLDKLEKNGGAIHLIHSKDDHVVPFAELEKYKEALPDATVHAFEDRQHFNQEEFPEIVEIIKSL